MNLKIGRYILLTKFLNEEFIRFLFAGTFNLGLTYGLYLLLLQFFPYSISFTISYVVGLIFVSIINVKVVFKKKTTAFNGMKTISVYLFQYLLSLLLLFFFVHYLLISPNISPLIITFLLVPITFFSNRMILRNS